MSKEQKGGEGQRQRAEGTGSADTVRAPSDPTRPLLPFCVNIVGGLCQRHFLVVTLLYSGARCHHEGKPGERYGDSTTRFLTAARESAVTSEQKGFFKQKVIFDQSPIIIIIIPISRISGETREAGG